jgi:hypothetical protein
MEKAQREANTAARISAACKCEVNLPARYFLQRYLTSHSRKPSAADILNSERQI